ncbi:hypothetical protein CCHR01_13584 [Colletotrichum chrysophilum]|uniref:Uncharacterized protein n=1 Tax=Colletotrichum chrysophilum TaxID=1836956 RepID=A0AAD9EGD5_9PEZI|nr:hypothetical protein CCHR01_13584 [Colletotrichum chrysophilum]
MASPSLRARLLVSPRRWFHHRADVFPMVATPGAAPPLLVGSSIPLLAQLLNIWGDWRLGKKEKLVTTPSYPRTPRRTRDGCGCHGFV